MPGQASKRYVSQLERIGGKQAVLFDELLTWLGSLWEGRRLAYTIATLSAAVSLCLWAFATYLTPRERR